MKDIILDKIVKDDLKEVKGLISYANKTDETMTIMAPTAQRNAQPDNLYNYIVRELSNNTRNTEEQLKYLNVFETALSVYRASALSIRTELDVLGQEYLLETQKKSVDDILGAKPDTYEAIKNIANGGAKKTVMSEMTSPVVEKALKLGNKISTEKFLSNRYALYFAGKVGLSMLEEKEADTNIRYSFGTEHDASTDRDAQTQMLAKQAKDDLGDLIQNMKAQGKTVVDSNLKDVLQTIFSTWVNQFNWTTYDIMLKESKIEDLKLSFENFSITKGEFKEKYTNVVMDSKIMRIDKSSVIGAEGMYSDGSLKLGTVLWNEMKLLTGYDHERGSNIHNPASVVFTTGVPGAGKTFIAHAYMRSFVNLCKELSIPVWAMTHSTTDYASTYQNETANALNKLGHDINNFPGIVLMYVADADNIFMSRKADLNAEQKNTMNIYFKLFDGTLIPKNGKFLSIMDANYVESIDDATKSRLFDRVAEVRRFEDYKDFAALAKLKVTRGKKDLLQLLDIKDKDWLDIGKSLLASPLSNREIDHVFTKIVSYELPDKLLGAPFAEHEKYRMQELKKINADTIQKELKDYVFKRADIEEKSMRAREEDAKQRFVTFLDDLKKEKKGTGSKRR